MRKFWRRSLVGSAVCVAALLCGCARIHKEVEGKYVYVTAKQTFLRDRVAAVSNRTGTVNNGDKLTVLEHTRRFVKVKTPAGAVGWIDEKAVATQEVFDQFNGLGAKHSQDPTVASGTVRDEVYMHIAPGRETDHFYRLAEGDKLNLLARASLVKALPPGVAAKAPVTAAVKGKDKAAEVPAGPAMEDWWLGRDAQGHTGWVYSRMIDVDAPEALARYAEGQRIVGAYVLTHVDDPDSGQLRDGKPDPDIPVYVTVLGPYKAGLPYDFDQVRVFSWNLKKHRYETAFRQKNIAGYLPVTITTATDPYGKGAVAQEKLPEFSFQVLAAGEAAPVADATTGIVTPGKLIRKTYRLEGNITRRILQPGVAVPEEMHPVVEPKKDEKGRAVRCCSKKKR